ncbi:MAG: hypothetical protein GYB68_05125, partial [Chloroflexi bacterium]|nr:hypothetical protein [Chloroflexota bacterium]
MNESEAQSYLIAHGLMPITDQYGQELFLRRAKEGDLKAVQAYIAIGMPIDVGEESTALIRAVEGRHAELLRWLIEAGANLEALDDDGDTALQTAVNWNHPNMLAILIAVGANVNCQATNGWTPLTKALSQGNGSMVRSLVEAGADLSLGGKSGRPPLWWAIKEGHSVDVLLRAGADPNLRVLESEHPLLVYALYREQSTPARLLIEGGADLNAENRYGWNAWMTATYFELPELVMLIEERGGSPKRQSEVRCLLAARNDDADGMLAAINDGADPNSHDIFGITPLMWAARKGWLAAAKTLVEAGADVNAVDEDGWAAISFAATNGHEALVDWLLDQGAKVKDGLTLFLHGVPRTGKLNIVKRLLDAGADPDEQDRFGQPTLLEAVSGEDEEANLALFEMLIEAGADVNVRYSSGATVLL